MAWAAGLALLGVLSWAGCTAAAVISASPEVLMVAGGEQLQALSAQDLRLQAQRHLGGRVAAGVTDGRRHELELVVGGTQAAWLALTAGARLRARYVLPFQPVALALDRATDTAYIAGNNAAGVGQVLALDAHSGRLKRAQGLHAHATALAMGQGGRLLVAVTGPPGLLLLQAADLKRLAVVPLRSPPRQVVSLPYGHRAFVLCSDLVAAVDTERAGLLSYLRPGEHPQQLLLKPDGGELYVSNSDGTVSIIDTTANEVSGTLAAGLGADALAVDAEGTTLYVANREAGTISVIALNNRKTVAVVRVGQRPQELALDGPGLLLFASDQGSDDVAVVRANRDPNNPNTLLSLLPSPPQPGFVAVLQP